MNWIETFCHSPCMYIDQRTRCECVNVPSSRSKWKQLIWDAKWVICYTHLPQGSVCPESLDRSARISIEFWNQVDAFVSGRAVRFGSVIYVRILRMLRLHQCVFVAYASSAIPCALSFEKTKIAMSKSVHSKTEINLTFTNLCKCHTALCHELRVSFGSAPCASTLCWTLCRTNHTQYGYRWIDADFEYAVQCSTRELFCGSAGIQLACGTQRNGHRDPPALQNSRRTLIVCIEMVDGCARP